MYGKSLKYVLALIIETRYDSEELPHIFELILRLK